MSSVLPFPCSHPDVYMSPRNRYKLSPLVAFELGCKSFGLQLAYCSHSSNAGLVAAAVNHLDSSSQPNFQPLPTLHLAQSLKEQSSSIPFMCRQQEVTFSLLLCPLILCIGPVPSFYRFHHSPLVRSEQSQLNLEGISSAHLPNQSNSSFSVKPSSNTPPGYTQSLNHSPDRPLQSQSRPTF